MPYSSYVAAAVECHVSRSLHFVQTETRAACRSLGGEQVLILASTLSSQPTTLIEPNVSNHFSKCPLKRRIPKSQQKRTNLRGLQLSVLKDASPRNAARSARRVVPLLRWENCASKWVLKASLHSFQSRFVLVCIFFCPEHSLQHILHANAVLSSLHFRFYHCVRSRVSCNKGCGICVKKCPFEAINIINLPKDLERNTTHRYGPNSFKLHRLPMPRPGQVLGLVGTNGIGKSTAIKILAGKLKPNLGKFDAPPDWEEILVHFRGSDLQNYFTKVLEDTMKATMKPQYVDHIPKAVRGLVGEILKSKDEVCFQGMACFAR